MFLVYFLLFVLSCQYQCKKLPGKTSLRNDLLCVEQDVNVYLLTHWHMSGCTVYSLHTCLSGLWGN